MDRKELTQLIFNYYKAYKSYWKHYKFSDSKIRRNFVFRIKLELRALNAGYRIPFQSLEII